MRATAMSKTALVSSGSLVGWGASSTCETADTALLVVNGRTCMLEPVPPAAALAPVPQAWTELFLTGPALSVEAAQTTVAAAS